MLNDARTALYSHPELLIYPGLCIFVTAAGFNLFGEALRDILTPEELSLIHIYWRLALYLAVCMPVVLLVMALSRKISEGTNMKNRSKKLDVSAGPVSYTHLDVYKRQYLT